MEDIIVEHVPVSGAVKVYDRLSQKVIFSGTEDVIPIAIAKQKPLLVYCVDNTLYIDVEYQKVYYDKEANWYYYESFFRSQYEEFWGDENVEDWTFEDFLADILNEEIIQEVTLPTCS